MRLANLVRRSTWLLSVLVSSLTTAQITPILSGQVLDLQGFGLAVANLEIKSEGTGLDRSTHSRSYARLRTRLDQQLGRHRFGEQMNLTNAHITAFQPLSQAVNLPSTRTNSDAQRLMLGVSDVALFGRAANPFVVYLYGQYRGEPFRLSRIPGHTGQLQPGTGNNIILGYGPWYAGTYNAVTVSLQKRFGSYLNMNAPCTFTQIHTHACLEFFNTFNRSNPASVEQFPDIAATPFGTTLLVLPGRKGQVGLRLDF